MNANTELSLSRRTMLQSTGALVVAFSMSEAGDALAQMAAVGGGKPALLPTELDSWIAIAPNGAVTIFFGKIDGGQGTDLAMAQIVAEELDVPIRSVNVVQGDTARTVNQGGASGSTGVRFAGAALRVAGAEARRVLVMRAAEKLGVAPERLTVNEGVVSVVGDPAKKISYAEMIGGGLFHSQIGWNNQYGKPAGPDGAGQTQNIRSVQTRRHLAAALRCCRQSVRHLTMGVRHSRRRHAAWPYDPPRRRGRVGRFGR